MNRFIYSLVGVCLTAISAAAGLVGPQSLAYLGQSADLIVVGTAGGTFAASSVVNFSIEVSRVVKGDSSIAGQTISVFWTSANFLTRPGTIVSASGSGIWFLTRHSRNQTGSSF